MSETDLQLLARYTRNHAEDAFAELVRRHVDLVHSAALRQVRSTQLAEEVAQSVFTDLALNAGKLKSDTILAAWLYHVTRRTAIDVVRREARRQLREQIATEMNAMNATTDDWTHIEPLLDQAMTALGETDRAAVLLRYFENKSLREVGQTLGTSDDAAQKRVSRAVEHLREFFAKRGITVGAGGLAAVISVNAVQAAPAGLAVTISTTAALAGTTLTTTATAIAAKTIAMTTLQKALLTATIAAVVGTGIYEAHQASASRSQVQTLQQQQSPLTEHIHQLETERDKAGRELALLREENERLMRHTAELLKLRGEVTNLRLESQRAAQTKPVDTNDSTAIVAQTWLDRVRFLRQRFEQWPGRKTPEIQLLTGEDWLREAPNARVETEQECLQSMANVRAVAKRKLSDLVQKALLKYLESSNNQYPTTPSQLAPFFDASVDAEAILAGYKNAEPGTVHPPTPLRADRWAMVQAGGSNPLDYEFVFCEGGYFQSK